MKEKIIKSLKEQGEYLICDDIKTDDISPCVTVMFRKTTMDNTNNQYDFEVWKSFDSWKDAENAVKHECSLH